MITWSGLVVVRSEMMLNYTLLVLRLSHIHEVVVQIDTEAKPR